MNLKQGTRLAVEVEPVDGGRVRVCFRLRVGNSGARDLIPPRVVASHLEALGVIEIWAQEEQARAGLGAVRR